MSRHHTILTDVLDRRAQSSDGRRLRRQPEFTTIEDVITAVGTEMTRRGALDDYEPRLERAKEDGTLDALEAELDRAADEALGALLQRGVAHRVRRSLRESAVRDPEVEYHVGAETLAHAEGDAAGEHPTEDELFRALAEVEIVPWSRNDADSGRSPTLLRDPGDAPTRPMPTIIRELLVRVGGRVQLPVLTGAVLRRMSQTVQSLDRAAASGHEPAATANGGAVYDTAAESIELLQFGELGEDARVARQEALRLLDLAEERRATGAAYDRLVLRELETRFDGDQHRARAAYEEFRSSAISLKDTR